MVTDTGALLVMVPGLLIVVAGNEATSVMSVTVMQSAAIQIKLYTMKVVMGNETNTLAYK
jgi:hypothetical protein